MRTMALVPLLVWSVPLLWLIPPSRSGGGVIIRASRWLVGVIGASMGLYWLNHLHAMPIPLPAFDYHMVFIALSVAVALMLCIDVWVALPEWSDAWFYSRPAQYLTVRRLRRLHIHPAVLVDGDQVIVAWAETSWRIHRVLNGKAAASLDRKTLRRLARLRQETWDRRDIGTPHLRLPADRYVVTTNLVGVVDHDGDLWDTTPVVPH